MALVSAVSPGLQWQSGAADIDLAVTGSSQVGIGPPETVPRTYCSTFHAQLAHCCMALSASLSALAAWCWCAAPQCGCCCVERCEGLPSVVWQGLAALRCAGCLGPLLSLKPCEMRRQVHITP